MKCLKCGYNQSKVIDSRHADDLNAIRRRRECEQCGTRFTTFERIELSPLIVVKKTVRARRSTAIKYCTVWYVHARKDRSHMMT